MPRTNWKLHCFFRVPNLCFGIQRQGPQDVEDSAKDGCGAWDAQNKKRMTYIMEGALCWKGWIFLATGSVACRSWVQCYGLGWKNLEDLPWILTQRKRSHQVRKNDGKHGVPQKNLGGSRPSHMFFFGPLNFFCSLLYCFFPEEAMVGCSSPSQSHPTNVSPHPSFWGLRSKAAHHWTWYCSKDCKWGGGASAPRVCWWTKMYEDGRTKASFDNKPTKTFRRSDLTKSKPSRKLTYPTWEKGKSSSNMDCFRGDMLIPWRVIIFQTDWNQQTDFAFQETNFHLLLRTGMGAPVSWQPRKYPFESFDVCPTGKWRIPMFNPFCHQGRLLISCVSPRVFRNEYSEKLPSKLAVSLPVVPKIRGLCRSSSKDVYIYIYIYIYVSVRETSFKTKQKSQAFYQEQVLYPSHATDHDS